MATPALIDLSNYDTLLVRSTQGRSGSPDGNVYFDLASGKIEFLTATDVATVTYPTGHPNYSTGTPEANPLTAQLGIKFEAIYAFENQERKSSLPADGSGPSEDLRAYDRWTSGTFKFGGAYNFINSKKPATDADREVIRGSGWNEYASDGGVDRIYFGNKGLSTIEATSQPYYMLSSSAAPDLNAITPVDFAKAGQFDEAVQVYGSTANTPSDATAGNFDTRAYEAVSVRTYGYNYDRKDTVNDLGIAELGGYFTGFAVNESVHLTTSEASMPFADVWTTPAGVWASMTLEELDTPQLETGFTQADGNFTWVLNNPGGATLAQCVAYLDAAASVDEDINVHSTNTTYGKRVGTWYRYSADGKIITQVGTGAAGEGLFIEGLVGNDKQNVIFYDDAGAMKTYPFYLSVITTVGPNAVADTQAWFHTYFAADYDSASAVTIEDSAASEVKGNVNGSPYRSGNTIVYEFDYDGDTLGGTAGTDKNAVFLCEGDGGVTQAKALYTLTDAAASVSVACVPPIENNV
jgi:hypothetical protein